VNLVLDGVCLKALLEDVSAPAMASIEALRVNTVQSLHSARQRLAARLEEKVIVGRHQAVHVAGPEKGIRRSRELDQKHDPVGLVAKERSAGDAARRDVKEAVIELATWRSRHNA